MSERNLHDKPFDEGTQDKLDLYRGYLREWIPVFLNTPSIMTINIFDFFAGPGTDSDGNPGSPVIALEEISAALLKPRKNDAKINLYFNEYSVNKYQSLAAWVSQAQTDNPIIRFHTEQLDFPEAFNKWYVFAKKPQTANLLFLDQNGVKQITAEVFQQILDLRFTDFLFFISSSSVHRFKREDSIVGKVPVNDDDLIHMTRTNVHRTITEAYRRIVPATMKYYLAPFSIKKGANVYGLIFGSHHPLAMDKFLHKCWEKDEVRGEANFDIDDEQINQNSPSLFAEMNTPKKLSLFEKELIAAVLGKKLSTNKDVYIFTLERGFLAKHAQKVIKDLMSSKQLPKQTLHISYDSWKKVEVDDIKFNEGALP